jgi:hypothetical protein
MGLHLDLSQLVEVGDAFFIERYHGLSSEDGGKSVPAVGFCYRYRDTPSTNPLVFVRQLHKGPHRNPDLTLVDPSDTLLTVREEIYAVTDATRGWGSNNVIVHDEADQPIALKHIRQERESLIEAWGKWKEIEPEIYAIIRKHLS